MRHRPSQAEPLWSVPGCTDTGALRCTLAWLQASRARSPSRIAGATLATSRRTARRGASATRA
eukprot:713355-Prymnesium_polylepis.1